MQMAAHCSAGLHLKDWIAVGGGEIPNPILLSVSPLRRRILREMLSFNEVIEIVPGRKGREFKAQLTSALKAPGGL